MKKLLSIVATLAAAAGLVRAAAPPGDKPELPPGPWVVPQMPAMAQWAVDYVYADALPPAAPGTPAATDPFGDPRNMRPARVVVEKTGSIRHERWTLGAELKQEVWAWGEMVVKQGPRGKAFTPTVGSDAGGNAFPEMNWISPEHFVGTESKDGKKMWVFKKEWFDEDHKSLGISTAIVDPDTRYPVSYDYPPETRHYAVLSPPQGMLAVPPEFAAAGREMIDHAKAATPHLAAP